MTAALLGFVWLLWPLIALAGGQGFAPLSGLIAILLLPLAAMRLRPRLYMIPLALFFAYAAASMSWSPRPTALVDFDFAAGRFDVRSEMLRVGLLIPAMAILIAAVSRLGDAGRERVGVIARRALVAQVAIVALLALFETQVLDLLSPLIPDRSEGVQNLSRNSLIMALAAPFLIQSVAEERTQRTAVVIALAIIAVEVAILMWRGVHAGVMAIAAAALAVAIVAIWRRIGFKILASGIAMLIWTAPMLFGFLSLNADGASATNSWQWRLAIWKRVVEVTGERPIEGSGLGVLRTIDETIPTGDFAGQMLVPNHAHNMMLQLWAETGAIGAGLLALAILMAGWRLPSPERLGLAAPRLAGLAGGMTAIACVSFDLWNEWWWATAGLLAVLVAVTVKADDLAKPDLTLIGYAPADPAPRSVAATTSS